jgi:hypothetical protein
MNYSPEDMIDWYGWHDEDDDQWDYEIENARDAVEYKLKKWWSGAKHIYYYKGRYEQNVEDAIWYHLERACIYEKGLVCDLKEWRRARDECNSIMSEIERMIRKEFKEIYLEKDDDNDPPVQRIPEGPIFEAWESFSIIAFKANCYGFGNLDKVYENSGKKCEKYYEQFLKVEYSVINEFDYDLKIGGKRYNWFVSSYFQNVCEELQYRNLVKNHVEYQLECGEVFKITKMIESQMVHILRLDLSHLSLVVELYAEFSLSIYKKSSMERLKNGLVVTRHGSKII